MARTAKLSVMLSEEMKLNFKKMADKMGMTESALAAYVIGHWYATQATVNDRIINALGPGDIAQLIKTVVAEGQGSDRT